MGADAEVETLLTAVLDEVLVGANTGGLEGLGAQLLILVGDEVDAEREVVDGGTLAAKIEDANLGVGDTTVEARLGVRLGEKLLVFCCAKTIRRRHPARDSSCPFPPVGDVPPSRHQASIIPLSKIFKYPFLAVESVADDGEIADAHLVLAVAVATSGTASHFVGFSGELSVKWLLVTGERWLQKRGPATFFR